MRRLGHYYMEGNYYIYMTAVVTSYCANEDFIDKTYDRLLKYD